GQKRLLITTDLDRGPAHFEEHRLPLDVAQPPQGLAESVQPRLPGWRGRRRDQDADAWHRSRRLRLADEGRGEQGTTHCAEEGPPVHVRRVVTYCAGGDGAPRNGAVSTRQGGLTTN